MKKIGLIILCTIAILSCKNDGTSDTEINNDGNHINADSTTIELTLCDCLDSLSDNNKEWCSLNFPEPLTIQQKFECTGDSSLLDTIPAEVKDSIRSDYENDLSLEIKEIEEEKVDPISEECKQFLEEYAEAIKDFKYLTDKVEKNPDDIGLKIGYASQSEEMNSWGSKPQMFQCSQSESFKTQVEILNVKKDKLIEN
jgi:hypothetical protein